MLTVISEDLLHPTETPGAESYVHAPTLLTSGEADPQREVRVWSPDRGKVAIPFLVCFALLCLYGAYDFLLEHSDTGFVLIVATAVTCAPLLLIPQSYHFATDANGIAISSRFGSHAFHWRDLQEMIRVHPDDPLVYRILAQDGRSAEIRLYGYSTPVREALLGLIRSHL